ncbi:hypothetical protein CROQUDRAFT_45043 [Cronartium quercuum f. sp. fusiforme G11]|uniref:Mitochondrial ribosomal protein L27 n=1 Tax=Cronartium quercuum f. sp. fusiforme G11 TaxID=708437 RepID=A0A9P6NM33_9BASI|nr:hypothetical protein CROQUDRAFT_45043 [Cronartium quercuum f. sp. fusiforme G11]
MSFKPSIVLHGARRMPLTSKQAGVGFYKGTGHHPALGPKSQGAHGSGRKYGKTYRLDSKKMRTFVVPKVVLDFEQLLVRSDLRPYTESTKSLSPDTDPNPWPVDQRKMQSKLTQQRAPWHNPQSIYSKEGFDHEYLKQLLDHMRKEPTRTESNEVESVTQDARLVN